MKITFKQFNRYLEPLKPIYFITGDEPLLVDDTCKTLRKAAQNEGFVERIIYHGEAGFNWSQFARDARSYSLFGTRQLFELHLTQARFPEIAAQVLQAYASHPPSDKLLLIVSDKLSAVTLKSAWLKAIDERGVIVQVQPIQSYELPAWLKLRLKQAGFDVDTKGMQLLLACGEGNLLNLAQMIQKLSLLYMPGKLTDIQIKEVVIDGARFNVFGLTDSILKGEIERSLVILKRLRDEGIEPLLILWALLRELRSIIGIATAMINGKSMEEALTASHLWEKHKLLIKKALPRYSLQKWNRLLQNARQIDSMIKGVKPGNRWDELSQLVLAMTGTSLFPSSILER